MDFSATQDRHQITFRAMEGRITADNPACFIDVFVKYIDFDKPGLIIKSLNKSGSTGLYWRLFGLNLPLWLSLWFTEELQP